MFGSEKWETLYRRKGGDGASPKRLSEGGGKRETKKISRCARNDSVEGCPYPTYSAKAVLRKHFSRIVIPSGAEGSFSLAVKGSVPDSEKWETPCRRKGGDGASPKRLSEGGWKKGTKKISRCARNDSVGNGYVFPEMSDAPKL